MLTVKELHDRTTISKYVDKWCAKLNEGYFLSPRLKAFRGLVRKTESLSKEEFREIQNFFKLYDECLEIHNRDTSTFDECNNRLEDALVNIVGEIRTGVKRVVTRPIECEALLYNGTNDTEVEAFLAEEIKGVTTMVNPETKRLTYFIPTGHKTLSVNDYIVRTGPRKYESVPSHSFKKKYQLLVN